MTFGVGMVVGALIGSTITMLALAVAFVAGDADREMERQYEQSSKGSER